MALQVTSFPVNVPSGIRLAVGVLNYNGATYTVNGDAVTAAQWGGGSNGIPNRVPDFVFFQTASGTAGGAVTAAAGFATSLRYIPGTGKVQAYGEEALVADSGLTEMDAEAFSGQAQFLAIWLEAAPGTTA
jgi:hypothetical protein